MAPAADYAADINALIGKAEARTPAELKVLRRDLEDARAKPAAAGTSSAEAGERAALEWVLENLMKNSVDATHHDNGLIELHIGNAVHEQPTDAIGALVHGHLVTGTAHEIVVLDDERKANVKAWQGDQLRRELDVPTPTLEGYLFPDTYALPRRASARAERALPS